MFPKLVSRIFVSIFIILFFAACPAPFHKVDLVSPQSVSAEMFRQGEIKISWTSVESASEYEVHRKIGASKFEYIGNSSSESYLDNTDSFNVNSTHDRKGEPVVYAIKSLAPGAAASQLSNPSIVISEWVRGLKVSKLEYTNKVHLSWTKQDEASKYIVYRYTSRSGTTDPVEIVMADLTTLAYDDNITGTFFYQVRWEKAGIEYGSSSPKVLGLATSMRDTEEPFNNDFNTLKSDYFSMVQGVQLMMFSLYDGLNNLESDIDYYKCKGERGKAFPFEISVPEGFMQDEMFIELIEDGESRGAKKFNGNPHREVFQFTELSPRGEIVPFYIVIRSFSNNTETKIGSYTVTNTF